MTILKPFHDRVVVLLDGRQSMSPGGIALPDTDDEKRPTTGTVMAVGPDVVTAIRVGQRVMFPRFVGVTFDSDKRQYLVLGDKEVIAELIDS